MGSDDSLSKAWAPLKDWTGAVLEPGQFIAYPGNLGYFQLGMVRSLNPSTGSVGIWTRHGTKTALSNTSRCIVLDDDRVLGTMAGAATTLLDKRGDIVVPIVPRDASDGEP